MALGTVESRSSSALMGFFAILVVILFSSIHLIFQIFLTEDSDLIWNDSLEGHAKFKYLVKTDENVDHNKGLKSDFFAQKRLDLSSMPNFRKDLRREKRVKKNMMIAFTSVVLAGSFIIWLPLYIKLMKCKMEKFISARKGAFLILIGVYFGICVICGIVISIIVGTQDLDDQKGTLLRGLKIISVKVINFQSGNNAAVSLDRNDGGMVSLSPSTWFLIYMECLSAEGYSLSGILPKAKITEVTELHFVMEIAKTRFSKKQALVQINGTEYSLEWLRHLHFCPEEDSSEAEGGIFLTLICTIPCVLSLVLWVWYRKISHEDLLMGDRSQELVQVQTLGDVIGNNIELVELITPGPDLPIDDTDPNQDSYIEEVTDPVESVPRQSKASVSNPKRKKQKVSSG